MATTVTPDGVRRAQRSFRGGPVDETAPVVRTVRRYVQTLIEQDHPCLSATLQCVTELTTNSLKHTRSGSADPAYAWFTVYLAWDPSHVELGVEDTGSAGDRKPRLVDAAATDETGRGLKIVEELATRWTAEASRNGIGWVVTAYIHAE